jgi:hypothetical protein
MEADFETRHGKYANFLPSAFKKELTVSAFSPINTRAGFQVASVVVISVVAS